MKLKKAFDQGDIESLEPEAKIGILCTVSPEGLPHVTLITSLQASGPNQVIWGQFSEGRSKAHVKDNPKTAFLVLTMDRRLWTGKALWTGQKQNGPEYSMFNEKPMFRYNAYLGIHTVHYMDLVEASGPCGLPLARLAAAMALTRLAGPSRERPSGQTVLTPWGRALFNRLDALKFISWVGGDGFPVIVPVLQCRASSSGRLIFSPLAYSSTLKGLETGKPTAVFGLTMKMEDILVRGFFRGYSRKRGLVVGAVDINWVYNSMPPVPGQIYPPKQLHPVAQF